MDEDGARDLSLQNHFAMIEAKSNGRFFFEVVEPAAIANFLGFDAKSRNPIYKFTLLEGNGEEYVFISYSLVLDGQGRSNTRAEALGRGIAGADGKLFKVNPFLLVFDYVGNRMMAVSAAKLFGSFADKVKIEPISSSQTATFALSPHFGNQTISMYGSLGSPDVWATHVFDSHPEFEEVRLHLLRFKAETDNIAHRIPEIVSILKERIAARDLPGAQEVVQQGSEPLSPAFPRQEIVEQIDTAGIGTGVEVENAVSDDEAGKIEDPFDPEDIDVITRSMTVDLLLSRTASNMIDLQPDFQRRWGIWDNRRQSRLIESLLLRIPLPVLYAAENDDERWEIVDGIQRLSTIARFIRPDIIKSDPLILSNLEYLSVYDGKTFSDLSPRLQLRLRETELVIHLIRKGTPPEVKFNIFARINTGGIVLSSQELRHAITPGSAREILEEWASSAVFKLATDGSVRAIRMDDRELVLRFIAFYSLGLSAYKQPDMDGFLVNAMRAINGFSDAKLQQINSALFGALETAYAIFEKDAFRKRFEPGNARMPINKALFEAVSVNLANLSQSERYRLIDRKLRVREGIMQLCNDRSFESAISQGTGDVRKVNRRFMGVSDMLQQVLGDA